MQILNNKLADIHRQLAPVLNSFQAQYISPDEVMVPEQGTEAYTEWYNQVSLIHKYVMDAVEVTKEQRVGSMNNIELGKKITEGSEFKETEYLSKRSFYNLYKRYEGYAPVFGKRYNFDRHDTKINTRLANDFFGEIVNQKASFIFGKPAIYYTIEENDKEVFADFLRINNIDALDMDTSVVAGTCGVAYRYYWLETDTLHATLVAPWDVVYMPFNDEPISIVLHQIDGKVVAHIFWLNSFMKMVIDDNSTGTEVEYQYNLLGNPIIEYKNNPQGQSHCHKAVDLMDAYDAIFSDTASELQQMRMAYLLITGNQAMDADEAHVFNERLKASGTIQVAEGSNASFLQKTMDMASTLNYTDRLEANIYRFCSAINYSKDTASGGQLTGVALRQRLQSIQNSCSQTWMSFSDSNDKQWQLLSTWRVLSSGTPIDTTAIQQKVTYNIPIDISEDVDRAMKMMQLGLPRSIWLQELPIFTTQEQIDEVMVLMDRDGIVEDLEANI